MISSSQEPKPCFTTLHFTSYTPTHGTKGPGYNQTLNTRTLLEAEGLVVQEDPVLVLLTVNGQAPKSSDKTCLTTSGAAEAEVVAVMPAGLGG